MLELFSDDEHFEKRLKVAMPLYGLRWAMIILNEYLPEIAQKRKNSSGFKQYDLKESQEVQLNKACHYRELVKTYSPN